MHERQEKAQDALPAYPIKPAPKVAWSAAATQLPVWTRAMGDQPPAALVLAGLNQVPGFQAKLEVSQPNDPAEQEADHIAEQVMRVPDSAEHLQPTCACGGADGATGECEECAQKRLNLQRRAAPQAAPVAVPSVAHEALRSPGQPLNRGTRAFMEPRFGADLSRVRVHTDGQAAESARVVSALAYTVGTDIVFGAGQYTPDTQAGQRLLAHELAHVIQQQATPGPMIYRKIGTIGRSGCSVVLGMDIGIYGPRATAALATRWQNWINTLWNGTAACHGNSAGSCSARVNAVVTAHPGINWWWNVPEDNSAYVREAGYRSQTNRAIDSGDWAENEDDRSIVHEVGHLMGQGDYYWNIPWTSHPSESGYVNDIMANYYNDPGPTEYGPALTRILADHDINCLCCIRYPPCGVNNCALNPGLPCSAVGEQRHCEWIRANNTPEALAVYNTDCSTLSH